MDLARGQREPLTLLELIRYNIKEEGGGRRGGLISFLSSLSLSVLKAYYLDDLPDHLEKRYNNIPLFISLFNYRSG